MNEPSTPPGALEGIRVIDVSAAVAGPWTSTQLADQGADVIMIEPVGRPDVVRVTGPIVGDLSGAWVGMNRNKRAIALNLRDPRGLEVLLRLCADADVFIQNFRPGVAERLGVGYEALAAGNPRLVYVSISGFGPDGPYVDRPVYDPIIQATAGIVTSQGGDQVRNIVADKVTALNAANAALAALIARGRTGRGQHIQLAMIDATLAFVWPDVYWNHALPDAEPVPTYSEWYEPLTTADGQISLAWPTDDKFRRAMDGLGRPELADDERFASRNGRVRNGRALLTTLAPTFAALSTADALARLHAADVPSAAVLGLDEALADPQVVHNATIATVHHPRAGRTLVARPAARFSETPASLRRHAPSFGEHTDEVLSEAGIDLAVVATLRQDGVIA